MFSNVKPGDEVLIGGGGCSPWGRVAVTDVNHNWFRCGDLAFSKENGNLAASDADAHYQQYDGFRAEWPEGSNQ